MNVSSIAGHKVHGGGAVCAATKHAVRALSEGLRQEVKPYHIRTTTVSPGAVATEFTESITEPDVQAYMRKVYESAIPTDSLIRSPARWRMRSRSPTKWTSTKSSFGRPLRNSDPPTTQAAPGWEIACPPHLWRRPPPWGRQFPRWTRASTLLGSFVIALDAVNGKRVTEALWKANHCMSTIADRARQRMVCT